jgi:hypothetical protein
MIVPESEPDIVVTWQKVIPYQLEGRACVGRVRHYPEIGQFGKVVPQ